MAPEFNSSEMDDGKHIIDVVEMEEDQSMVSPAKVLFTEVSPEIVEEEVLTDTVEEEVPKEIVQEDVPIEIVEQECPSEIDNEEAPTKLEDEVIVPPHEAFEAQELVSSPQHQERRLEDVRRVRDEAQSLRQEICVLRSRLEEVEEESKFHAAKANELTELLMNSNSCKGNSGIDDTIIAQSDELAKRSRKIEKLEKKVTKLTTEKAMLEVERDNAKKETAELSAVVRSLQNVTTSSMDVKKSESDSDDSDDESDESEEIVLTPETALDLTLSNLKEHIEMLEDGLQTTSTVNSTQKKEIAALEMDNLLQQTKIELLEELFRELNAHRLYEKEKANEMGRTNKDKSDKKEANLKESKKKKSNKKEQENDNESTTDKSDTSSRGGEAFKASAAQLTGLVERFRSIRMGKQTADTESKEVKPEIPAAAAAAAHAAKLILGKPGKEQLKTESSHNKSQAESKSKEKKATMRKVKIKFKKAGLEGVYQGPLVDKKPHGVGTIRFTNGDTYLGEMTRGKMSGTGTLYTKNKGVFRGLFENNKFVGDLDSENDSGDSGGTASGADAKDNVSTSKVATDKTAKVNAVAALELDGFSPTTITGSQDILAVDESFRSVPPEREENESFLKEFSGSERSSNPDMDESLSLSSHSGIAGPINHYQETTF